MNYQEVESFHTTGIYSKRPITIVQGKGALLWDDSGNKFIDCIGGHGASSLGHANPEVANAISAQASKLINCPETFYNDNRAQLMKKISDIAPDNLQYVFLCNSGSEANEAAIKFARLITNRKEILAAKNGFHGRTMGALSATWEKKYKAPFEPLVPGFLHREYNNFPEFESAITNQTAAVIIEIIQGEGGITLGNKEFLREVQRVCRERGALLIIDEIVTAFGRTGAMFASQHYGLTPDLITLGKSIAGGVPMGAVLINKEFGKLPLGVHGSTFGGNPLACAASLAAIKYLEENSLVNQSKELGGWFMGELRKIKSPTIQDVRGLGLMIGVELKNRVSPYINLLIEKGILVGSAGANVLRFTPPLVISKNELDVVIHSLEETLIT
jgi:acetylornithine/LysW-gamma-L-lysine aminotransferase